MKLSDRYTKYHILNTAFTLIELLVVISIIGILIGLSIFGLQGARASSRDARRKADLEQIRSGLEIYKADCDAYPTSLGQSLYGNQESGSCSTGNNYISSVPVDPIPTQSYKYTSEIGTSYVLCAALEQSGGSIPECGSCGTKACNYVVTNP